VKKTVIYLAVLGFIASTVSAQTRPDFSGRWTLDVRDSSAAGGGEGDKTGVASGGGGRRGGGLGLGAPIGEVIIRQNSRTLTVEERRGTAQIRLVYQLDGSAVTNQMWIGNITRGHATKAEFRSKWDGPQLVTTITTNVPDAAGAVVFKEVRSLDAQGRMVVDIASEGKPGRRTAVYRR
jgi:hypothetical protein